MHDFHSFIGAFRTLKKAGGALKLQQMYLLVETKPMTAIWQMGPYVSWNALLKGEFICSVAYYNSFEQATQLFKKGTITLIGADAAVTLAKIEEPLREAVLDRIKLFVKMHGGPPTNPLIWSWVRPMRFAQPPRNPKNPRNNWARH